MMEMRLAFPQRSPQPFMVPWTMVAPASTPARALATARSLSLWVWMPTRVGTVLRTTCTTSAMKPGRQPPLVSHRVTQSAPAAAAAFRVASAYSGLAL
jgi:hypothetical protein